MYEIHVVLNFGAELSAFGVNDAETCRCNMRLYFYVKYTFVGVVNE
jgi:hypothetical protein